MERQDFINTINDLRSTIESLRLIIATLQRTIESLHEGEKRYKKQASAYEEMDAAETIVLKSKVDGAPSNWKFLKFKDAQSFGSEEGVQEACLFFTLCETCKNFSVNFKEYVAYAAKELISGNTDYESLAPWAIKLV